MPTEININQIESILQDLYEYFDDRADVDYDQGQPVPNEAMQRLNDIMNLQKYFAAKEISFSQF